MHVSERVSDVRVFVVYMGRRRMSTVSGQNNQTSTEPEIVHKPFLCYSLSWCCNCWCCCCCWCIFHCCLMSDAVMALYKAIALNSWTIHLGGWQMEHMCFLILSYYIFCNQNATQHKYIHLPFPFSTFCFIFETLKSKQSLLYGRYFVEIHPLKFAISYF